MRVWRIAGVWERLHTQLREAVRRQVEREPTPSAAILDIQSVKTTERAGPHGYDGAKKLSGRKRHILVDILGLVIGVLAHPADFQDRATDIVTERGDEGVARIKDLTDGFGAHAVIEAAGTQESMLQAIRSTRAGGYVGSVGASHGVEAPGEELFFAEVHLLGGPAPVRRFLPELIDLIWNRKIDPGAVFDLTPPLEQAARATARWTSAAPSRRCGARKLREA